MFRLLIVIFAAGLVDGRRYFRECWTDWYDRDDPTGTGDWELIARLRKENPRKICKNPKAIEVQTVNGVKLEATGDIIYRNDVHIGFVCRTKDQPKKRKCKDYRVRFWCYFPFCGKGECWTDWYDRDDPSGTGDWELLSSLHSENPGKICNRPFAIQAETLAGVSAAATGDRIYKNDANTGFVCRKKDQPFRRKCHDYRVRFRCYHPFCGREEIPCLELNHIKCWTKWFDRDNPTGTGDWERLKELRKDNPGMICDNPIDIQAETLQGLSVKATGEVIHKNDAITGFVCKNKDQPKKKMCSDYRVRFSCDVTFCGDGVCWSKFFDRDNPSGTGDWERLSALRKDNPGQICKNPFMIDVRTADKKMTPATQTGENFHKYNPTEGFVCLNKDQKDGKCRDYKVRFLCPCHY